MTCAVSVLRLAAALALAASLATLAADAPPAERAFVLSYYQLGPNKPGSALGMNLLLDRLDTRPEARATVRKLGYGESWDKLPKGVAPGEHTSVVLAMFGKRLNIMAFQFAGPGGAASLAVCRPALEAANPRKFSYINTIVPGPESTMDLAMIELASAIGQEAARPAVGRSLTKLVVTMRKESDAPAELTFDDDATEAPQSVTEEQLEAVRAVAMVAAWDNRLQPTFGDAPDVLTFQVARVVQGFAFTVTSTRHGKPFTVQQYKLDETMLYPGLKALVARALAGNRRVVDLVQVDQEAVEPLALVGHELIYAIHQHSALELLRATSIDSMLVKWSIAAPDRGTMVYAAANDPAGRRQAWQYNPSVAPVDPLTGAVPRTTWPEANFPWSFALPAEETVIVAGGRQLIRQKVRTREWSFQSVSPLTAGPLVAGERVLTGSEGGILHSLSLADGTEAWQRQLGGRLLGPIVAAGDRLLAASEEGRLSCLAAATGEIAWQVELGDALTGPPWVFAADRLAVASGTGDLRVLSLTDGRELAAAAVPALVNHIAPLPVEGAPAIATVDAAGTVRFHGLPGLTLQDEIPLGFRPGWPPLFVPMAPVVWGRGEGLIDEAPLLLVPDFEGNLWILKATP